MSPDALVADRVHREIKQRILAGKYASGTSLTVQSLADIFGTSISPVRDALNRLVGERLVEIQPAGGFMLPEITSARAYNLYSLHADLVRMVVKVMAGIDTLEPPPSYLSDQTADGPAVAAATSQFFALLAGFSPNREHLGAIVQTGERLALLRLHEGSIAKHGGELAGLWNVTRSGNRNATRIAMWHYHRRRLLRVEGISIATTRGLIEPKDSRNRRF
ncbi:GntR family transcriptional regulator [Sphingobium yanoikuyae]|uniref:GntR family transcriptional regulator n=1 Tax=Sphingobium yanoikuyae TaxID=13690 RepID=A0A9X7YFF6_SPHYA|nr:GntR family transcriptional regulator [Sphingobium yanoikuyae]QNG48549.1 GntR family transcriptional regulator [Sphingobium yanoikuyae]